MCDDINLRNILEDLGDDGITPNVFYVPGFYIKCDATFKIPQERLFFCLRIRIVYYIFLHTLYSQE